jgi:cobalt-zinc-cadmium efflux system membrane fusion protein
MISDSKMRFSARNLSVVIFLTIFAASCGSEGSVAPEMVAADADFERGPHNGRMLREGDFALEITVFETGVPPEFRVYPYFENDPVNPAQVGLGMAVARTGGQVDRFSFAAQEDFLRGQSVLIEPHSFDVSATAQFGGASYSWTYDSYEGRTTIARPIADAVGVAVEVAGPAIIEETVTLQGVVELLPEGRAEVRAWYPGRILTMRKFIGDEVQAGEVVARIEAAQSLQAYSITAPFSGFVVERHGTEGGVAGDEPLYVLMDPTRLHAELFVFTQNAQHVRAGQEVEIRDLVSDASFHSDIEIVLSPGEIDTPMRVAHVEVPVDDDRWWPGMAIEGEIVVGTEEVPLAVRTLALQRFRDFTVVYGRFGDTYEVRMLELGRQTPEWTEVLGGLQPGTTYVTDNAFLIRADVEKDGAVHDH